MSLHKHVPHPHLAHRAQAGPVKTADSFNSRFAAWGTKVFGSMPAFYLFVIYGALGAVFVAHQATLLYWSNWIQLWSLPLLMVGAIVLGKAADKRSQQEFLDVEALLHGQDQAAQHLSKQDDKILDILHEIQVSAAEIAILKQDTALLHEIHEHVTALAPQAGEFTPDQDSAPPPGKAARS